MFNPRLTETLSDFPFARLNALLAPIEPPPHLGMINMAVGEPQGAMPAFARQIVNDEVDGWNRYPPNQGLPELNTAICEWLTRRYRLPVGLLDAAQHVHPTAGSKEGVYIIATVATPQQKGGAKHCQGGGYFVSDYDGLAQRSLGLAVPMGIFLLSLAGIPFFAGWAAKFFVFRAVVGGGGLWLAVAMAINTVIALFYYAAVVRRMFFAPPSGELTGTISTPAPVRTAMALAAVAVVVVGILPELFAHIAELSSLI